MFCDSNVSMAMRLVHGRYCSADHKEAYFQTMDRLGLERLNDAKPRNASTYQPCTKAVSLESQAQPEAVPVPAAPKTSKTGPRMRPHLDLAQGEAAAIAGA